ncbi:MAG TPA: alpha-L-arabinofuranosidase C-terminal domain-containing protein [Candidatus Acidoferrum sp.]|nr:alpha-L-arabinofuranosidase C-terminal domain-containing protein [Candidatus Acidoferrum sp.]
MSLLSRFHSSKRGPWKLLAATVGWSIFCAGAGAQFVGTATLTIPADRPGAVVSTNLFGIFFEEINFAGEGGLYAEMVRNRSFDNSPNADYWTLVTQGTATGQMSVDGAQPLNTNRPHSLQLTMLSGVGSVGAANAGFWGLSLQAGSSYNLSLYARAANGFTGPLSARLESANGSQTYAQASFNGLSPNWQRFTATLTPTVTDTNALLTVSISQTGTIWLTVVSLFPSGTFHNRTNGLRADLANSLAGLGPSFLRYPGGNFIESWNVTNAVRWKKTVGDLALRPGHLNDSWGYWSTDGFGLHEFLLFCEDLGMEPLYGINAGLCLGYNGDTNNTVPLDQMGPWVQDALDLIEYCNGDTNTTWGAQRAANGHPAPFNLKYLEIGNENGGSYYNDRYALFYSAIKSNYPAMHLIVPDWGGIPTATPVEIQDEHYYSDPATFISYATKYDSYSRSGPHVFVGEYAVTSGYGTYGNLSAALGEAAFMTGMERNADIVLMASYAPLFANVNSMQWQPDLIYYDSSRWAGTPSYYVQQMFSQNRGDVVLPASLVVTSTATNLPMHGAIGAGSWNTAVEYTNIVVTSNGVTLYQSDFVHQGTNGWRVYNGTWSVNNGCYQQTSATTTDCRSTTGNTNWANYTISLRARKTGGSEGFLILFNWLDDYNWTWWNIGGWNNTLNGIEQCVNGSKSTLGQVSQSISANVWYDISIVLTGSRMQCYLNGVLSQDITYPATVTSGLLASTTYSRSNGQIIVKAVNPYNSAMVTAVSCTGLDAIAPSATLVQLTSGSPWNENSLDAPTHVIPATSTLTNAGTNFTITFPVNSLSVLRLQAVGVHSVTNLQLQIPSPINAGQVVPAVVWGWNWGETVPVNLATNTGFGITYSSLDPGVATVDASGNIRGTGPGATSIVATYGSVGLAATQMVQVVAPAAALVHRYSFEELGGSIVSDSVGGPAWNGTLPNGGTFGGGQLALDAGSQQYVQLPGGILSNYTAVTIEAWFTFPSQLPVNCFLYGFGNINGASGNSYIFCAPQGGRIAITPSDWTGEQDAYSGIDFSFQTNFHLVAVYDPPAGSLALYTNGVLSGINNSVTVPLSSVTDVYSFIGKSLYSGDPYPSFSVDEFRIYNGALYASDVSAAQWLGPEHLLSTASPPLAFSSRNGVLTLSWPLAASGYTLLSKTNLPLGAWHPANTPAPQPNGGQWQVTLPMTPTAEYFRLQR